LHEEPRVPFGSFTFAWEQRELSDYLEVSNEKNRNNIYDKNDVLSVSGDYGIVNQIEFQGRSFAGASVSNYGVVHTNDVVYTKSPLNANPYGIIKTNKGKTGIVSTLYAIYHPKKNTYSNFVQNYFEQHARMNNYMHPLVNKGAKNDMKVSSENALKGYVVFPNYDEQFAISTFFDKLDHLITLHQRKCKKFSKSKGYSIFSKKTKKINIFHKKKTITWEQRELKKICSMHARIGWQNLRTSEFLDSGEYYLITGTDFENGTINFSSCHYVEKDRYEQDKKIQIKNGSILITKDGTLGKVAFVSGLDKPATLNAGVFNVEIIEKNIDNKYLYQYLKAPFLMEYVDKKATGGTIKHLNQNILVDFPVLLPPHIEQQKIGTFFCKLDNLITLHQREPPRIIQGG